MDPKSSLTEVKQPIRKRRNRPPKHVRTASKQAKLDGIQAPTVQQACQHMKKIGRAQNYMFAQRRVRKKGRAKAQTESSEEKTRVPLAATDAAEHAPIQNPVAINDISTAKAGGKAAHERQEEMESGHE